MDYPFADLLKGYRKRLGWDQQLLADAVARSRTTISNWERSITLPEDRYVVLLLAQKLKLTEIEKEGLVRAAGYKPEENKLISAVIDNSTSSIVEVGPLPTVKEDWGDSIDVSAFYGRQTEIFELERWIVLDQCRMVAVLGMGGIGKSALIKKLVEKIKGDFNFLFWRDLRNTPSLDDIIKDCIALLSHQQQFNISESLTDSISLLLKYLRKNRCLLILDNFESILRSGEYAGQYREGYESYELLIKKASERNHRSCLIITSREKPREITALAGSNMPVRATYLLGLDHAATKEIFTEKGVAGSEKALISIADHYAGNPLALRLLSAMIVSLFDGNAELFLEKGVVLFGDILDLLDEQFQRLSSLEQDILYWLAIQREPMLIQELQEDILQLFSVGELLIALESLRRRSLVEVSLASFALQPVVAEYLVDKLVKNVFDEFVSEKIAYFRTHALMKAQSVDYIRNAQAQLILKPLAKRLFLTFSFRGTEEKMERIISKIRGKPPLETGYVAGNFLNLLCQMSDRVKDLDFSGLTIWQSYLRNTELHNVDFTHSSFIKCVFVETFGFIVSVAFSSNGKLLCAGTNTGEVLIWDLVELKRINRWTAHSNSTLCVTFSPDASMVATSSDDGTSKLWDVANGQLLHTLSGHANWIWSICFSPNGELLASASNDHSVRLWDVTSGKCVSTLLGHSGWVTSVDFNYGGDILATSSSDTTIRLWDVASGKCVRILKGHTKWVIKAIFSPNSNLIASGGEDQVLRLWDSKTGQCVEILHGHTDSIWSIAFSNTGELLASGGRDQTVRILNVRTKEQRVLLGHTNRVFSVSFNSSGDLLASGSEDQTLRLWDVRTGQCLRTWQGYTDWVRSVAFSPDNQKIISGGEDQMVRIWDIDIGQYKTLIGHTGRISHVAFSPKKHIAISSGSDKTIRVWDILTEECIKVLRGHSNWVASVAFNNDGQRIVSGSDDHTVRLWDVESGQCVKTFKGHTNWVRAVVFSPVDNKIISGSDDGTLRIWRIDAGSPLKILQGNSTWIRSIAISPNSCIIAAGCGNSVYLWDFNTGQQLKVLEGHTKRIFSIAISPDNKLLVSGSEDQTIRLWDIESYQCIKILQGHTKIVTSVSFNPNGEKIVSSSEDKTIKLWSTYSHDCIKTLKAKRVYEGTIISGITGLSSLQIAVLKELGAIDRQH